MAAKKKPEKQDDEDPGKKKPMQKKQRASTKGRKLVRWEGNDDIDQYLLLTIESVCKRKGVKIPYDEVAEVMGPKATGGSIEQHLAKLRLKRYKKNKICPPPLPRSAKLQTLENEENDPRFGPHPACMDSDPGYEPTCRQKKKSKARSQSSRRVTKRPRACARKTVSPSTTACVDAPFLQFSPKSEDNSAKRTSDECPEDESSTAESDLSSDPEDPVDWQGWKRPKPKRDNSEDIPEEIPEERSVPATGTRLRIVARRSRADSQMRSSNLQSPNAPASSSALQGSSRHRRGTRVSDGFQGTTEASGYSNEGRQSSGHLPNSRDPRYENPFAIWTPNENTVPLRVTADPMFHGLPLAHRQRVAEELNFNVSDPLAQDSHPVSGYDDLGFFESALMGSTYELDGTSVEPGFDPADTSYLQNAPNWMAGQRAPDSVINDWYQNNEAASLNLGYLPQIDNSQEELPDKSMAEDADENSF